MHKLSKGTFVSISNALPWRFGLSFTHTNISCQESLGIKEDSRYFNMEVKLINMTLKVLKTYHQSPMWKKKSNAI